MKKGCIIDNFWDASIGVWMELYSIPHHFELFSKNETSSYYTNADKNVVIRSSNHWGSGIGQCNWYLLGYERRNSYKCKEVCGAEQIRIGAIMLEDLIDVSDI